MLELTRRALRARRAEPALGDGDLAWVSGLTDACLVLRRPAGSEDPHVLVAMNLGDAPAVVEAEAVLLTSAGELEPAPGGFVLPPDTAAWLR
jgi:alpha-glucosidase